MISPILAIRLGGPGALVGYLLTAFLGSAATFTEVTLSVSHRTRLPNGQIMGGPMQYLERLISHRLAKWYALLCLILEAAWSGAQSNQLAALLASPQLGSFSIPTMITGSALAIFVLLFLIGGIRRIAELSGKLVPLMFVLCVGACFWIIFSNISMLPAITVEIFKSLFSPYAMATGALIGGITSSMRWGIFKGVQTSEAGVGTQTIPHSMAETQDPVHQGILAMVSTYSAGKFGSLTAVCNEYIVLF